jgi:RsiW-degrading membrane proteinase PrsW (M82 family)
MPLLLAVILSFVPAFFYAWVVYWMDRYEKEPRALLGGVFLWGAIAAVVGALFWSLLLQGGVFLLTQSEAAAELTGAVLIAPFVEETVKGLAVLLVFLAARQEFDSILDGIIYASITALGFAATENVLYLYNQGYLEHGMEGMFGLFFLRVILGGWNHAVYTAFTGIGLAVARLSTTKLVRLTAPAVGWLVAVFFHALHNTLATLLAQSIGLGGLAVTLLVDWIGWVGIFATILFALARERRWITTQLSEEVELHTITPEQYRTACSAWARSGARLRAIGSGRYRATRQFYQLCAELAQKKHQRAALGEEYGNTTTIERLRAELVRLTSEAGA